MFKKFALTALAAVFISPALSGAEGHPPPGDDGGGAAVEHHDGDGFYCQLCDLHFETAAEMDEHARAEGHLEDGEHHGPPPGHDGEGPRFEMVDADQDREISLEEAKEIFMQDFEEEYEGQAEAKFSEKFAEVDANNDGIVDPLEFKAERKRQQDLDDAGESEGPEGDWQHQGEQHTSCDPNQEYPVADPGPDGGCGNYEDCNGNGAFDLGEPCNEGESQAP